MPSTTVSNVQPAPVIEGDGDGKTNQAKKKHYPAFGQNGPDSGIEQEYVQKS